jgi:predicted HTH domain antitoxin
MCGGANASRAALPRLHRARHAAFAALRSVAIASLVEVAHMRVAPAIHLGTVEHMPLGRAAELPGYAPVDLQDFLRSRGTSLVIYDRDECDHDTGRS